MWHPACAAAGVRAVPYDGRHTYASLLIHEGRSIAFVAASMGHASATTTLRHYGHMFDESRLGTGASMVDAIRAARGELGEHGCSQIVRQDADGVTDELDGRRAHNSPFSRTFPGMGATGLEPVTPSLSSWCSPN